MSAASSVVDLPSLSFQWITKHGIYLIISYMVVHLLLPSLYVIIMLHVMTWTFSSMLALVLSVVG